MTRHSLLGRALALSTAVLTLTSAGAAAFEPTVTLDSGVGQDIVATDIAARSGVVVVAADWGFGSFPFGAYYWSTDSDATTFSSGSFSGGGVADQTQGTFCGGSAVAVARSRDTISSTASKILRVSYEIETTISGSAEITTSGGNRTPDVACIADQELAIAWFQKKPSGWSVRLAVRNVIGEDASPQTLTVGGGSVAKGLAVASSADRVLVAWVDGSALKVRRYAIGPAPAHTLTSLGTATILTDRTVRDPKIAIDGVRAIVAYQQQADLRVRWSTDRGATFGAARTLRDEPFPSEIGASPTTVALSGKRAVVGAVELGGIETLTGTGMSWKTSNAGSTWTALPVHAGGRTVATLVRIAGATRYAEAWDQSIARPSTQHLRFRRE